MALSILNHHSINLGSGRDIITMTLPSSQWPREPSARDTWTQLMVRVTEKFINETAMYLAACRAILFLLKFSVFVLDTGFHVFVWVGKEASSHEKGGGLMLAHVSVKKSIP